MVIGLGSDASPQCTSRYTGLSQQSYQGFADITIPGAGGANCFFSFKVLALKLNSFKVKIEIVGP